jgi:hypothetical protein
MGDDSARPTTADATPPPPGPAGSPFSHRHAGGGSVQRRPSTSTSAGAGRERWQARQRQRVDVMRRYSASAARGLLRSADLQQLSPTARLLGEVLPAASVADEIQQQWSTMQQALRGQPAAGGGSGGGVMMVVNPGTLLKAELLERAKKKAAARKQRFETIMRDKEEKFAEVQREKARVRARQARARDRVRMQKRQVVQANMAAAEAQREKNRAALYTRLAAQDERDEQKRLQAKRDEEARIRRDMAAVVQRQARVAQRRDDHEAVKAYFAPIHHAERFLLEPLPVVLDRSWAATTYA